MSAKRNVDVAPPPTGSPQQASPGMGGEATRKRAAPRHPSLPHLHLHSSKKPSNLVVRSLTIIILGPLLFICAMHSKESCTFLIFLGVVIGGIEWTGLKRHLKVALLLWGGSGGSLTEPLPSQRSAQTVASPPLRGGGGCGASGKNHSSYFSTDGNPNAAVDGDTTSAAAAATPLLTPSLPSSPLLANGEPLRPEEYPLPVTPVSLYTLLKHIGWAGLAVAAYVGVNAFAVTLAMYFLIFVCVTVMAHNQLEMKVEKATASLSNLESDDDAGKEEGSAEGKGKRAGHASAQVIEKAVKKAQRSYFLSLELQMIAEKQPTEQFLDFCLDIFGILWISGLVYPIFLYGVPRVGVPWGFATLLGNFCNDIMALVVGRSLKTIRQYYTAIYDLPHIQKPQSGSNAAADVGGKAKLSDDEGGEGDDAARVKPKKSASLRPLSEANPALRVILRGPHPLYPAISPNKSTEGAVAGVITNALVFATSMVVCYSYVMPLPEPEAIAHRFHSTPLWLLIGLIMGILGVVGDLLQSLLKRAARVKDAGFIVPGHGGILDRLDGCLLVFPFMFCMMSILHALS